MAALAALAGAASAANSTYYNPILPGWHSDPSCVQVEGIFYCVTSTFISFPGLPIYASRDLVNWKHVSHVWNRESQLPDYSWATEGQQHGMYAATIRHRDGVFYVICEYLGVAGKDAGVLFRTTDPFNDTAWSDAATFVAPKIDPDLFWDEETGKAYVATQGVQVQEMNLETGEIGPAVPLWNGTGGVWPEGPHIYRRDDAYYLMIAEGGTAEDHAVTIARSTKSVTGPYEASPNNPILTNRGTDEYFQTVGHADLFQDLDGNWWGVALATRSGPEYKIYPMGRETVLFPVTWNEGDWPILQPVRGEMSGWPLPPQTRDVPGDGPFNSDPDEYDFTTEGEPIPRNLVYWRVPRPGTFATSNIGLRVEPGRNRLDGWPGGDEPFEKSMSFIGRRQTDSLFTFSVDLNYEPNIYMQTEAGVTAFLTQASNLHLGLIGLDEGGRLGFRFNALGDVTETAAPEEWFAGEEGMPIIRFEIRMAEPTEYTFAAMLASDPEGTRVELGTASAELLSGGSGSFVGTLLGVYVTCNGAVDERGVGCPEASDYAYFTRWRYTGEGQYYTESDLVPHEEQSKGKGKGKEGKGKGKRVRRI
ncbi:glycoside hydrolase family 43 protein [Corynascus similis CBS 632.67]